MYICYDCPLLLPITFGHVPGSQNSTFFDFSAKEQRIPSASGLKGERKENTKNRVLDSGKSSH